MDYNRLNKVLSFIKEANSTYTDPDAGHSLTSGSYAPFQVEDEENIERLNKFLRAFSTERHCDPKQSLVLLRTKLNTIGLDFPYDGRRPLSAKEVFNMTQFGGRQGMNDKGEMFADDGISHRTGGKGLELHVETTPLDTENEGEKQHYMMLKMMYSSSPINSVGDLEPKLSVAPDSFKKKVNEEKDACYHAVKASYDDFPSAYASGQIAQCRQGKGWAAKKVRNKNKD